MVKWYNVALPRLSRGFDYPWPHKRKAPLQGRFSVRPGAKHLRALRGNRKRRSMFRLVTKQRVAVQES